MIRRLHAFIHQIANGWSLGVFGVAALSLVFIVNVADFTWTLPGFKHRTHGVGILDMEWHYSADRAYDILSAQGEAGRAGYWRMLWTVDIAIPLLVSLWLAIAAALALRRLGAPARGGTWLVLLPLMAGFSDYVENGAITALLTYYPQRLDALATAAGYVTSLKHTLYALALVSTALIGLRALVQRPQD
jgi:hypothetical protein